MDELGRDRERERHFAGRDGLDAQLQPLDVVGGDPMERRLQLGCVHIHSSRRGF